jgi:hypothetical protein
MPKITKISCILPEIKEKKDINEIVIPIPLDIVKYILSEYIPYDEIPQLNFVKGLHQNTKRYKIVEDRNIAYKDITDFVEVYDIIYTTFF